MMDSVLIDIEEKVIVARVEEEFLIRIGRELPEGWRYLWCFRHRDFVRKRKRMARESTYKPLWSPIQTYFNRSWRLRWPMQFTFNTERLKAECAREERVKEDMVDDYLAKGEEYKNSISREDWDGYN